MGYLMPRIKLFCLMFFYNNKVKAIFIFVSFGIITFLFYGHYGHFLQMSFISGFQLLDFIINYQLRAKYCMITNTRFIQSMNVIFATLPKK